ncbi:bifunctional hydroxymethylpyrimidine kinase/phosphomethylpyrimidine kinase [Lentilactobacillus sp. Marseille-Q4993]|uniref:bifunctional hydroxymethylpyrimidine kinase/phosphomethylpyrimidine kinase n=1 Tax=Lentilactobacillus sp. Marseille-Q4993 TaxID=3039492 RepID=UPI0024BD56F4|nr:bifunctional hydroxymethylpyrimidine kinase/phosphomethylpyrimidine kinase [Lentilactobacillus sp. Marseille-Q4993]
MKNKVAPVFIAQDYSAVGRMSTVAAQSVMAAFGVTTAAVPTALFSTQTEGFGTPARQSTDEWLKSTFDHWQDIGMSEFSAGIVGYVGDTGTLSILQSFIKKQSFDNLIIDPVMGDRNDFYPGLGPEYAKAVMKLGKMADILTPNVFELAALTGTKVPLKLNFNLISEMVLSLQDTIGKPVKIVVTGVESKDKVGVLYLQDNQLQWFGNQKVAGHFYGTGDLLTSLLAGFLTLGTEFDEAVKFAVNETNVAIMETANRKNNPNKYGLSLSAVLADVAGFIND